MPSPPESLYLPERYHEYDQDPFHRQRRREGRQLGGDASPDRCRPRLALHLVSPDDAREPIAWDDLDNPDEPRTLCQHILGDRKVRVDRGNFMADRPPSAW